MKTQKILLLLLVFSMTLVHGQAERYSIKNIDANTIYSDFGVSFYNETTAVFASSRKDKTILNRVWVNNKQPFLQLYKGEIGENGEINNVKLFSKKLNTKFHESNVSFTKDLKTVYFSRNNYLNRKIKEDSEGMVLIQLYHAEVGEDGEWTNVQPMPFNSDNYQTGHPTLSTDEKTLYFISDMPGSFGKTDIYKADIGLNGDIGDPINMGSTINTAEREMFTSISGGEMYFSSDGRADGLGGLDVYVSNLTGNEISEPQNLGTPINSEKDDFAFVVNHETQRGYFSSNREGGHGDDDIYTFVQEPPLVIECNHYVKGSVTEENTGLIIPEVLVVLYDNDGKELDRILSNAEGNFNFEVECNKTYKIVGVKEGYSESVMEFSSTDGEDLEVQLEIKLEEFIVERGNCIVNINPIYFDFDKSFIRADAEIELDKVVEVMKKYPELIIEGGSHTDSRGPFKYNEGLSTRRAKSTVAYILSKGIDSSRITAKGYGETQLVNNCVYGVKCSEEEHQLNRRTEFVIQNLDEIRKKYPELCN